MCVCVCVGMLFVDDCGLTHLMNDFLRGRHLGVHAQECCVGELT